MSRYSLIILKQSGFNKLQSNIVNAYDCAGHFYRYWSTSDDLSHGMYSVEKNELNNLMILMRDWRTCFLGPDWKGYEFMNCFKYVFVVNLKIVQR